MAYGIDNFLYTIEVNGKTATYKFTDPGDITNVAEGVLNEQEIPKDNTFDSREATDLAYAQVSVKLNEKRNARVAKEAQNELKAQQETDAASRASAADFQAKAQETVVEPAGEETREDGTVQTVYNTSPSKDSKKK